MNFIKSAKTQLKHIPIQENHLTKKGKKDHETNKLEKFTLNLSKLTFEDNFSKNKGESDLLKF
jgi:hypothetical protein